uniref:Uncharacterized protein n=1 Tax=Moniliophthora roreri TaxID=221103 RepID=A0A0W0FIA9_MONRR
MLLVHSNVNQLNYDIVEKIVRFKSLFIA